MTALLLKETAPTPSEDGLLGGRLPQGEGQVGGSQRARTPINVEAECEVTSAVPPDGRANPGKVLSRCSRDGGDAGNEARRATHRRNRATPGDGAMAGMLRRPVAKRETMAGWQMRGA